MKIAYTVEASAELEDLIARTEVEYPSMLALVKGRIEQVVERISNWPESAITVTSMRDVRVTLLGKLPYRLFYHVAEDTVTVLHIHHVSRSPWNPRR